MISWAERQPGRMWIKRQVCPLYRFFLVFVHNSPVSIGPPSLFFYFRLQPSPPLSLDGSLTRGGRHVCALERLLMAVPMCGNKQCGCTKAYYRQMQIRSADEPMTTFYKCVECGTQWREN